MNRALSAAGGAALIAGTVAAAPLLRRWYQHWGATVEERSAAMCGDELLVAPRLRSTRAVTVLAPPEDVWPWLVQVGQGRGGLYSYDLLERLVGCDIHSAQEVLAEHQQLDVGDLVRLGPDGYPCYRVAEVQAERALVLLGADPTTQQAVRPPILAGELGASWQWSLQPLAGGRATRLVVRQRTSFPSKQSVLWHLVEPVSFVMERAMLLGIRDRAEQHWADDLVHLAPLGAMA